MTTISPMVRSALMVADLDRSTRFYREVLGLDETWYAGELSNGNAHQLLGMPAGSLTRACILKAPGPAWGMIGLFEISDPAPAPVKLDSQRINLGETCLVFYHADLDHVQAALEDQQLPVLCPPLMLVVDDQPRQREMSFRDPDGVLINLIEWDQDDGLRPEQK
jgi:catechol 2,3-dioxygenase-like lactoylglutathione lyase family enzyme